ncbi:MAG TPA: pirin family protein [Bacteroidales bacterium]|nr:pirin family protein [Bacteroidales bacterium]
MKTILHTANSRGHANHGWLDSHHTFSFANYYNPERVHFGMLRVLNDDQVVGGEGFGQHPHDNMEIISIPLEGSIEHKDSMGNATKLTVGEIQVMSAGTGIFHSEFNPDPVHLSKFLQIWVFPAKRNTKPRYSQISLEGLAKPDTLYQIVSPNADDDGAWIGQQAWFHLGDLSKGWEGNYELKGQNTGVYVFVLEGKVNVSGQALDRRDGLGIYETKQIEIHSNEPSKILLMEVPMDATNNK